MLGFVCFFVFDILLALLCGMFLFSFDFLFLFVMGFDDDVHVRRLCNKMLLINCGGFNLLGQLVLGSFVVIQTQQKKKTNVLINY